MVLFDELMLSLNDVYQLRDSSIVVQMVSAFALLVRDSILQKHQVSWVAST
jgi:hypothetical protein